MGIAISNPLFQRLQSRASAPGREPSSLAARMQQELALS
jgi:hypothetical protein